MKTGAGESFWKQRFAVAADVRRLTSNAEFRVRSAESEQSLGAVNTSVTLVVQYIGNTFGFMVHTFFLSAKRLDGGPKMG